MSAAATAAGYLYASGRLRGRAAKEQEQGHGHAETPAPEHPQQKDKRVRVHVERAPKEQMREQTRVAVYPQEEKPRRTPKIEYRRKRWTPE
jgi:hypothetical protein